MRRTGFCDSMSIRPRYFPAKGRGKEERTGGHDRSPRAAIYQSFGSHSSRRGEREKREEESEGIGDHSRESSTRQSEYSTPCLTSLFKLFPDRRGGERGGGGGKKGREKRGEPIVRSTPAAITTRTLVSCAWITNRARRTRCCAIRIQEREREKGEEKKGRKDVNHPEIARISRALSA